MAPIVDGLKEQFGKNIEFRRLNVGSDPAGIELANRLGVQYVPTFVFVGKSGIIAQQLVGEQTAEQLKTQLAGLK